MKSKKGKIFVVLIIIVSLMFMHTSVIISEVNAEIITDSEGDVSWSFDSESGTLTFSGVGEITTYWQWNISKENVKKIIINKGITSIGSSTFSSCENLNEIILPEGLVKIGYYSFSGCKNLKSITIPNTTTTLVWASFADCDSLQSVQIPKNLTNIGGNAFLGCNSLTQINVDKDNPKYVSEDGNLYNKSKTELIAYPAGKNDNQFYIFNNITKIGWGAFAGNTYLEKIIVPNTVTEIDAAVFQYCQKVKVYCKSNSKIKEYAQEQNIQYIIDDDAPTIDVSYKDGIITIIATDAGVGLADEEYSLDNKEWCANNEFQVNKNGKYTVYARDKLGNIATKEIEIILKEQDTEDKDKNNEKNEAEDKDKNNEKNEVEDNDITIEENDKISDDKGNKNPTEDDLNKKPTNIKDGSESPNVFGQYGNTKILSLVFILLIFSIIAYVKSKKYNLK